MTPRGVPRVSPLRRDATAVLDPVELPAISPAEPVTTYVESAAIPEVAEHDDEPALPDEARARAADAAVAPTLPSEAAGQDRILHVRFSGVSPERLVSAMEAFKGLLRDRPGGTRVVIHVPPSAGGTALPMELRRGVAYDSELIAEVRRRLGEGVVDLSLA